jgi:ATP-dependent Clp protease ATP-binding subunit ClpA
MTLSIVSKGLARPISSKRMLKLTMQSFASSSQFSTASFLRSSAPHPKVSKNRDSTMTIPLLSAGCSFSTTQPIYYAQLRRRAGQMLFSSNSGIPTNNPPWVNPQNQVPGQHLEQYGVDLTKLAKEGKLDPVIGRHEEIRRTLQILARRTKNNPVLIGEPGVGKTAIGKCYHASVTDCARA